MWGGGITRGTHCNQQNEMILTNTYIIGEITDPFGTQKPIEIGKRRKTSAAAYNHDGVFGHSKTPPLSVGKKCLFGGVRKDTHSNQDFK